MINVNYKIDKAYVALLAASRRHLNPNRYFLWVYALIGFAVGLWMGFTYGFPSESVLLLVLSALGIMIALKQQIEFARNWRSGPNVDRIVEWQFSERGFTLKTGSTQGKGIGPAILQIRRIPGGVAIFPNSKMYNLIPEKAFASTEDLEAVMSFHRNATAQPSGNNAGHSDTPNRCTAPPTFHK